MKLFHFRLANKFYGSVSKYHGRKTKVQGFHSNKTIGKHVFGKIRENWKTVREYAFETSEGKEKRMHFPKKV